MQSLCLNKLEVDGPQVIAQYPANFFSNEELQEIPMKVIPLNAKDGDFTTIIFRNNLMIVSYVFTIQEDQGQRPSLMALSGTLDTTKLNPFEFKNIFESLIDQLGALNLKSAEFLGKILPKLYDSLSKGKSEISITKTVTLKIEISDQDEGPSTKQGRKNRSKGMW
jgi:hypothetical protein